MNKKQGNTISNNEELRKVNNLLLKALIDLTKFCEDNNISCELELAKEAINKALNYD